MDRSGKMPHVGIVGAGASGLRCADVLLSRGFKVTILEARNRIGGRICQSNELGYTVDIGPNWIHTWDSGDVHPILKLAIETNTPLHHWNGKQLIYDSSGHPVPTDKTDRLSTLLWEIIEKAFESSSAARDADGGKSIPAQESLWDFVSKEAAKQLPADEESQRILVQMCEMWGAYVGEPVWKQSLRFAWMEECCGGEEVFIASSYAAILKRISKPAREKAEIVLNAKVVTVIAPERSARNSEEVVVLKTEDGRDYAFDEVVMATPLGWLQKNMHTTFQPALPPRLSAAINNLKLSQLEKVFVTFPSAFWLDDPDPDPASTSTSTSDSGPNSDTFPAYTNWLTPAYAPDTNPCGWPQELWNLAALSPPNSHPTLLFYLYGDCSRHVVDSVYGTTTSSPSTSPTSSPTATAFLRAFFSPYYSRLPHYDASLPECQPTAFLASAWLKDDLAGNASYCNFQVGVEAADQDILALRAGCGGRGLWFCGEHAAPFEECGTVAGAYLSGQGVAERIAAAYGR